MSLLSWPADKEMDPWRAPNPTVCVPIDFPWDACRKCYSYPGSFSLRFLRGFQSDDAEFLLANAFTDAKIIIKEWLDWENCALQSLYNESSRVISTDILFLRGLCIRASQSLEDPTLLVAGAPLNGPSYRPRLFFMIISQAFLCLHARYAHSDILENFVLAMSADRDDCNEDRLVAAVDVAALAGMLQRAFEGLKVQLIADGIIHDDRAETSTKPSNSKASKEVSQALAGHSRAANSNSLWTVLPSVSQALAPKKRNRRNKMQALDEVQDISAMQRVDTWPRHTLEAPVSPFYPFLLPGLALGTKSAPRAMQTARSSIVQGAPIVLESGPFGGEDEGNKASKRKRSDQPSDLRPETTTVSRRQKKNRKRFRIYARCAPDANRSFLEKASSYRRAIMEGFQYTFPGSIMKTEALTGGLDQPSQGMSCPQPALVGSSSAERGGQVREGAVVDEEKESSDQAVHSADQVQMPDVGAVEYHAVTPAPIMSPTESEAYYISLKGVDVLSNHRYRVQLNTFQSQKRKFSRNSSDLHEALWIFEVSLLISDKPLYLEYLQKIGNFHSLLNLPPHFAFFTNSFEYYLELGINVVRFHRSRTTFNEEHSIQAVTYFDQMRTRFPPKKNSQPAMNGGSTAEAARRPNAADSLQPSAARPIVPGENTTAQLSLPELSQALKQSSSATQPSTQSAAEAHSSNPYLHPAYAEIYEVFQSGLSLADLGKSCVQLFGLVPGLRVKPRLAMDKEGSAEVETPKQRTQEGGPPVEPGVESGRSGEMSRMGGPLDDNEDGAESMGSNSNDELENDLSFGAHEDFLDLHEDRNEREDFLEEKHYSSSVVMLASDYEGLELRPEDLDRAGDRGRK